MSADTSFKLAIVVPDENEKKATVKYCSIPCFEASGSDIDCVTTFEELPKSYIVAGDRSDSAKKRICPDPSSKALSKSFTATYDATSFLSNDHPQFNRQKKNKVKSKAASRGARISTEQAAFILSRDNSADSTFRSPQYHSVTFSLSNWQADGVPETAEIQKYHQFLMIRQVGLQRSGPTSLSKELGCFEAFDVVEVCTGMCLFSEEDLDSCVHDGAIEPAKLQKLPISLSEMEIIARLATTIANTSALYYHGCESQQEKMLRINIDIPSVQYYQHALESYSNAQCTAEDVLGWMAALRSRRRLLFSIFANAIRHGLKERRVSAGNVAIHLSRGLDGADEGVFCALKFSYPVHDWIELIMQSVLTDSKELWPDFMHTLTEQEQRPSSWREFSTLSYMYEVAKPVLWSCSFQSLQTHSDDKRTTSDMHDSKAVKTAISAPHSPKMSCAKPKDFFEAGSKLNSAPNRRVLLLAIDDHDECRIYTKANQALCRLSTTSARSPGANPICSGPVPARILTICPAPQVVVGTLGSDPNWTRPSLWRSLLRSGQTCERLQLRNEKNMLETDVQVLKKVYDADLVAQIEGWVGQGG